MQCFCSDGSEANALRQLQQRAKRCQRCLDAGYPIVTGAVLSGPSTAQIMVVGQAPGVTEVESGRPFSGSAGRRLFAWLADAGWPEDIFRATQYLTAITKCYPGRNKTGKGDRVPTRAEQKLCALFLESELALLHPRIIIPVGGLAIRHFLGQVKLADVVGYSFARGDAALVPLPHPSGASLWLNKPEHRQLVTRGLDCIRRMGQEYQMLRSLGEIPT
jgi:uracil-DNA glycosylase